MQILLLLCQSLRDRKLMICVLFGLLTLCENCGSASVFGARSEWKSG